MTKPTQYLAEVAELLEHIPGDERMTALSDLAAAFEEGVTPDELGSPEEYVHALTELPEGERSVRRVLGVPVDVSAFSDPEVHGRAWDPENPDLFVPRSFGAGWDLNFGALAVRLGLLRPDDLDPDVIAAIPPAFLAAARFTPAAFAAITCASAARAWHDGAARLPTSWSFSGRVKKTSPRLVATLVPAAASLALAAWGARTPNSTNTEEAVTRPALAATLTSLISVITTATAVSIASPERKRRWLPAGMIGVPLATGLSSLVVPVRAGLARITGKR